MLIMGTSNPKVGRFQVQKDMLIVFFKLFDLLHENGFHLIFILFFLLNCYP